MAGAAWPEVAGKLAGRHLDLVRAPFTLPSSRILVFRSENGAVDGLRVHTAEYEKRLEQCRVIDELIVSTADGTSLPITTVLPQSLIFGGGAATLVFDGVAALSLGATVTGLSAHWTTPGRATFSAPLDPALRIEVAADRTARVASTSAHAAASTASAEVWTKWFAKCPRVRADLQEMTAFCWWVLGANIVSLPRLGDARAVVPSKIGYVGLWQWDAYFIAVGLRNGDPQLAREQLELAFGFPTAAGQLPDVVHEKGVLASSDDLPAGDRDRLRRAGSQIADPTAPVPLTKPPLAAWALRKVLDAEPLTDPVREWAGRQLAVIRRSQDWWFAASDLDGDGLPEYGHPYSSGLDDSPIFDGPLPTTAPDLGAYLVLQDLELARFADEYGFAVGPHLARADRTLAKLLQLWDADAGRFCARAAGETVTSDAITGLMPLLTGRLPTSMVDSITDALDDPRRYGTPWGLPTLALDDPDFSATRMWRGPVWVNTNTLVAEGLAASGHPDRARRLRERTVALVIHACGPHEYFNPLTGEQAPTATTAFGWSAALFIDHAVWLSR